MALVEAWVWAMTFHAAGMAPAKKRAARTMKRIRGRTSAGCRALGRGFTIDRAKYGSSRHKQLTYLYHRWAATPWGRTRRLGAWNEEPQRTTLRKSPRRGPEGRKDISRGVSHRYGPQMRQSPVGAIEKGRFTSRIFNRPIRGSLVLGAGTGGLRHRLISVIPSGPSITRILTEVS